MHYPRDLVYRLQRGQSERVIARLNVSGENGPGWLNYPWLFTFRAMLRAGGVQCECDVRLRVSAAAR
jgi:hypothetical protein